MLVIPVLLTVNSKFVSYKNKAFVDLICSIAFNLKD